VVKANEERLPKMFLAIVREEKRRERGSKGKTKGRWKKERIKRDFSQLV
jgi:hypothetical protein